MIVFSSYLLTDISCYFIYRQYRIYRPQLARPIVSSSIPLPHIRLHDAPGAHKHPELALGRNHTAESVEPLVASPVPDQQPALSTDQTGRATNHKSSTQPLNNATPPSVALTDSTKGLTAEERMRKLAEDARVLKEKIASLGSSAPTDMIDMLNKNTDLATKALAAVEHTPTLPLPNQPIHHAISKVTRQQDRAPQRTRSSSRDRSSSSTRSASASTESLPGQGNMHMAVKEAQRDVRTCVMFNMFLQ